MSEDFPEKLGRYRILRRLGTGGMAEVFLAKSSGAEGIEKLLVLKRVLPSFSKSQKFVSMFIDEAKVAARLNHPNVVQVYGFEQLGSDFLLAMELVDGIDLAQLLRNARQQQRCVEPGMAAFIVSQVARGLDYAHKRRDPRGNPLEIVHRDVSPQNVLISREGAVKIADFGIAKAALVTEETGVIKGKFAYMSPEQARGEAIDRRSDVYALGVLLGEIVLGRSLYQGLVGLEVLSRAREADLPSLRQIKPDTPEALIQIVERATEADPEQRFQSARSMASALTQYLHSLPNVHDGETLEALVREVAPERAEIVQDAERELSRPQLEDESRERRRVVVVSVDVRGVLPAHSISLLESIAYKVDAVISWPEGKGKGHFRYIVGLGKLTVNDPLRAVQLAIDTLDTIEGINADTIAPMEVGIGLSRGLVATIRDGAGRLIRYAPIGEVLEFALELARAAPSGATLAAGEVHRLVRRDYSFDSEVQEVRVSTVADGEQKVAAWRLLGAVKPGEHSTAHEELQGREFEMRLMHDAYKLVVEGPKTEFRHVVGEIGIGKTALLQEFLTQIRPSTVLYAECAFGASDVPFSTLKQLVSRLIGSSDSTSEDTAAKLEELITSVIPPSRRKFLRDVFEPLLGIGQRHREAGDDSQMITKATETLIAGLAAKGPVVAYVDNLQWVDSPSLEVLRAIRERRYPVPVLALLVGRGDERIEEALGEIERVVITELERDACRALVEQHVGAEVPDEILELIYTRAGGNPFFLQEVVDVLLERGAVEIRGAKAPIIYRVAEVPAQLPTTIQGVVAAKIDNLSEDARRALRWMSVSGDTNLEELRELAPNADQALEELRQAKLITLREERVSFFNAVIRQVAYEGADVEDRVRMHRRMGERLREANAPPGRIARHLEQARERDAAASAYLDAARAASELYSNRESLRFYTRALELLAANEYDLRFEAHRAREQIFRFLGLPDAQGSELDSMERIARQTSDAEKHAVALLRHTRYELDRSMYAAAETMFREAKKHVNQADKDELTMDMLRIEAELGRIVGDTERALSACERALSIAGSDETLLSLRGQVRIQQGIVLRRIGRTHEALDAYAEAFVIFRQLGVRRLEGFVLNSLGVALIGAGELEEAIKVFRASIFADQETGDRLRLGRKLSNVGQLYCVLGDTEKGENYLQQALSIFGEVNDKPGHCDALVALAGLQLRLGDTPRARRLLDEARETSEEAGAYERAHEGLVRARLEVFSEDLEAARRAAKNALVAAEQENLLAYRLEAHLWLALLSDHGVATAQLERVNSLLSGGTQLDNIAQIYQLLALASEHLGMSKEAEEWTSRAKSEVQKQADLLREASTRQRFIHYQLENPLALKWREMNHL